MSTAVALAALLAAGHRMALGDLRHIEADYVASREPTACAIQALTPLALGPESTARQTDRKLLEVVTQADREVRAVRRRFDAGGDVFPYPPVRDARKALGAALDAQERLYDVMVRDPERGNEEYVRFAAINGRAEARISSARRSLAVAAGSGWSRRFVCDQPPPRIPPR